MSQDSEHHTSAAVPIGRSEIFFLVAIVLLGFGLRFALPGRMAVEHFDEGVYASNIWFGNTKGANYPEQHLFAPPLLSMLIEFTFLVTGPSNVGAMFPGQLLGSLTPLVLWWLGRQWFGTVAGGVAALLCALSDVHILLSRSALTDVPMGLFWLLAMLTLREACTTRWFLSIVVAGYCVSLAWWTKYNGWMPLGIVLGAILIRGSVLLIQKDPRALQLVRKSLTGWLMATVVAVAFWLPWVWSLQSRGGYAGVMSNHRRYVVGFGGWVGSLTRQIEQLTSLSGLLTTTSLALVAILAIALKWGSGSFRGNDSSDPANGPHLPPTGPVAVEPGTWSNLNRVFIILNLLAACVWSVSFLGLSLIAYLGLTTRSLGQPSGPTEGEGRSLRSTLPKEDLGRWILLVWWVGLSVSTPLYTPYLRLTIPWLLASFLGVGFVVQRFVCSPKRTRLWDASQPSKFAPARSLGHSWYLTLGLIGLTGLIAFPTWQAVGRAFARLVSIPDRTDIQSAGISIANLIQAPAADSPGDKSGDREPSSSDSSQAGPAAVYVFAEPALLFQLRLAGLPHVAPAGSLSFAKGRVSPSHRIFLAVGIHAKQDPQFLTEFQELSTRFKLVGTWPWHLSPLVSLDQPQVNPSGLGHDPHERSQVELYQLLSD